MRLSLACSLQAAYAAAFILLPQSGQADRAKAFVDREGQHREALARASLERQEFAAKQSAQLLELLDRNTSLTQITQALSQRIEQLTDEIHRKVVTAG